MSEPSEDKKRAESSENTSNGTTATDSYESSSESGEGPRSIKALKTRKSAQNKGKVRTLSSRPLIISYNVIVLLHTVALLITVSKTFMASHFRINDYSIVILSVLFGLTNLLRSLKQAFVRGDFGFFYENRRRGFATIAISLLNFPDTKNFKSHALAGISSIISLALAIVLTVMGFFVVDLKEQPRE